MKQVLLWLLFFCSITVAQAQQQDCRALLDTFYRHSKNNFMDIMDKQTDTVSVFYPAKLQAGLGEIRIGKFPYANVLCWEVPLGQSEAIQAAVARFIEAMYSGNKLYKIVNLDEAEEPGGIATHSVYRVDGARKPLLVFQTMCYRNQENASKSRFAIMMYSQ
ncbi:hypothetical protein [Taibaiella chishuiensis]|uniref:Uncharacterized protein n=1 Tax=Taibaiella chishuiensis TaxID=1434707 RepID=A0A2P8D2W8_9BACT|nr:hypothetical protein [Taibaiella chishuiensis]PSK91564.1 hypothetical protein B0I18_105147 [Taibaiella chishuiensis]